MIVAIKARDVAAAVIDLRKGHQITPIVLADAVK